MNTLLISHDDKIIVNKDALLFDFFIDKVIEKTRKLRNIQYFTSRQTFDDANENSLILSFNIWGWRFLMTGDAYQNKNCKCFVKAEPL